jgi:hypothetical protein
MQALGSFISPVLGFDGDILILAILVSTRPPREKPASDPFAGGNASASETQASKRKVAANLTPQKKAKKATRRSSSVIKTIEPALKALASTPPSGPRQKILIHCSKRYSHHEYVSS